MRINIKNNNNNNKTENAKGETKEKKTLCNKIQWRTPTPFGTQWQIGSLHNFISSKMILAEHFFTKC
jgi:hypothetical protein